MTLKDYEFLISTMEKVVSLDTKSSTLNEEKKEKISKKTNLDAKISSTKNRIEELQRRNNSTDNSDSLSDVIREQQIKITSSSLEIRELRKKIRKLDNKISPRTRGKTFEHWKENNFSDNFSIIDGIRISGNIGIWLFIIAFIGFTMFTDSPPKTISEYPWYLAASYFVPFLLYFGMSLFYRHVDKKNMPILIDLGNQRKRSAAELNEKRRAENVLIDTMDANIELQKDLKHEDSKLKSLRVPLIECLSEIEAIESEMAKINHEIVNLLESVSHLTPYNTEL